MLRTILTIFIYLTAGYTLIVLLFVVFQDRLLYIPGRHSGETPEKIRLDFESVTLTTVDGESLDGWWIPAERERAVLLFCHGNAGTIADRLYSIRQYHNMGLSVFIFDYRGYGLSTGKPSEEGLYRDVEAAWDHLTGKRYIAASSIVVFGRSLGAAVATWIACKKQPGALILESAFTSVPDIASDLFPFLPVRTLARPRYDNVQIVSSLEVPKLFIHSVDDEIIPFTHGRHLFDVAAEPKAFCQISGGHNDGFYVSEPHYLAGIESFLDDFVVDR